MSTAEIAHSIATTKSTTDAMRSKDVDTTLYTRRSPELIVGLVGAVGSGVSTVGKIIKNKLKIEYGYEPAEIIKVSDLIVENCSSVNEFYDENLSGAERIDKLQSIGNLLRNKFSYDYLVEKCIQKIAAHRYDEGYNKEDEQFLPLPKKQVHIIDSLKHPDEVRLLKDVYGDMFWLVAVFCPESKRKERLEDSGVNPNDIGKLFDRDEYEELKFGQKVRDTCHLADFFVRNDGENQEAVEQSIDRYLEILFNVKIHTPTRHESAMYEAVAASSKSACMSRQVGASIYSKDGELLSVGWNDVPRYGGGLYREEDERSDHRCYLWKAGICHNDDRKDKLYQDIFDRLRMDNLLSSDSSKDNVINALRTTDVRNLIEFSRSVHAEMEAIIAVARKGKSSLIEAYMYSTTFPCHSCSRHIVASGISKVFYIEPYAKSLAYELHSDSISREENQDKKVEFLQYEGVAPKNMIKLFGHHEDRKQNGRVILRDKSVVFPVFSQAMDSFATHEQMVLDRVKKKEKAQSAPVLPGGENDET